MELGMAQGNAHTVHMDRKLHADPEKGSNDGLLALYTM
jgi:hypothetical protein